MTLNNLQNDCDGRILTDSELIAFGGYNPEKRIKRAKRINLISRVILYSLVAGLSVAGYFVKKNSDKTLGDNINEILEHNFYRINFYDLKPDVLKGRIAVIFDKLELIRQRRGYHSIQPVMEEYTAVVKQNLELTLDICIRQYQAKPAEQTVKAVAISLKNLYDWNSLSAESPRTNLIGFAESYLSEHQDINQQKIIEELKK